MFHVENLGLTFFALTNCVAKTNFALKYRFTQWVNVFAGIQTQNKAKEWTSNILFVVLIFWVGLDVRTAGNNFSVLGLGARFKISQKERKLSGWTQEECFWEIML